jgi:hypothetical protein
MLSANKLLVFSAATLLGACSAAVVGTQEAEEAAFFETRECVLAKLPRALSYTDDPDFWRSVSEESVLSLESIKLSASKLDSRMLSFMAVSARRAVRRLRIEDVNQISSDIALATC